MILNALKIPLYIMFSYQCKYFPCLDNFFPIFLTYFLVLKEEPAFIWLSNVSLELCPVTLYEFNTHILSLVSFFSNLIAIFFILFPFGIVSSTITGYLCS